MQSAKNKLHNSEQSAYQYAQLTPDERALYQSEMVCPGCGGISYYRGPSRNGRAPCFCGFHEDGCEYAAIQSAASRADRQGAEQDNAIHPGQRIIVDLTYGAHQTINPATPRVFESRVHEHRNGVERGSIGSLVTRRRPSSLLHKLIKLPHFSESRQPLEIDDLETNVADFFVRLDRLLPDHINQLHGYWGRISNAAIGGTDALWLNSGGYGHPNAFISRHLVDEFLARHQINRGDYSVFAGAYMLVVGILKTSWEGKLYIEANDLANIAVCFPTVR